MSEENPRPAGVVPAVVVGTVLPFIALVGVFSAMGDPIRVIQECGVWGFAVLFAIVVCGLGAPALAGFTNVPKAVWAGVAAIPLFVGVLGAFSSAGNVIAAIVNVNFADRAVIAAAGTAEVASIFVLGCVVGGACLAGTALVAVVAEAGFGGGLLLGAAGTAGVLGVRWLSLRAGLHAASMVSAADRATMLAQSIQESQLLSFVLVGVSVVGVVGGLALGMTRPRQMNLAANVALAVVAVVVVAAVSGAHLRMNSVTDGPAPFPPGLQLVSFPNGDVVPPPSKVIHAGRVESLHQGDDRSFALDASAHGADIRAAIPFGPTDPDPAYDPDLRFSLAGPSTWTPPPDLAVPAVFAPLLERTAIGVEVGVFHDDEVATLALLGTIGVAPKLPASLSGKPIVNVGQDPLHFGEGSVAVMFDDGIGAADFAAGLAKVAAATRQGHVLLVLR